MSGTKYIWISRDEWQRLQRAAGSLRTVQRDLPRLIEQVRRQTQRDLDRNFTELSKRQRASEQALEGLSEHTRRMERESSRRLEEHARELRRALDASGAELRAETRRLLAEQEQRLRVTLAEERQERERQVAELQHGLGALVQDKRRAAAMAEQWLQDARRLRDLIRQTLPHDRLAPGQLQALEPRLAVAEQNARAGMAEAALVSAQEACLDLSGLRVDLEFKDREWRLLQTAAQQAVLVLEGLIAQNAVRKGVDRSGQEIEVALDVDYWTDGALSALQRETGDLLARVQDERRSMTADDLRHVVETQAPELERRLQDVVQQAGAAQLAAQLRVNIADMVVETLVENGYQLDEGTFAGDDQRQAFAAKVTHLNGSEVVVIVAPVPGDPPDCVLRVESFDTDTDAEEIRIERAAALARSLRDRGLKVGAPEAGGGDSDERLRDMGAIRAATPEAAGAIATTLSAPRTAGP